MANRIELTFKKLDVQKKNSNKKTRQETNKSDSILKSSHPELVLCRLDLRIVSNERPSPNDLPYVEPAGNLSGDEHVHTRLLHRKIHELHGLCTMDETLERLLDLSELVDLGRGELALRMLGEVLNSGGTNDVFALKQKMNNMRKKKKKKKKANTASL
jgi:hypothetical protein